LRAGAGKLTVATGKSIAPLVAQAVPEARVIALTETSHGAIDANAAAAINGEFHGVLIGPGMLDEEGVCNLVRALLPRLGTAKLVLDAFAMSVVRDGDSLIRDRALITPHAGEMAHLAAVRKEDIAADPQGAALKFAAAWRSVVALKGATTVIATADGKHWIHEGGNVGLAVSGSGDVLAGIIAALAARGASLEQAAVWGVALHAQAGEILAKRIGPLGYLAREILPVIPEVMKSASGQ
jgi:ADP-dependent NAD(P)H-hydrate dehydratase